MRHDASGLKSVDRCSPSFKTALQDRALGKAYPFLVCLRDNGRIIGTTRILDIHPDDKKVEIGVTWIASEFWGTGINIECKQLLLTFCLDTLGVGRVQFRAKADNARSRRALEKIGRRSRALCDGTRLSLMEGHEILPSTAS